MKLENAIVLVTGGSRGIGLETARYLKEGGAKVAICGRDRETLERAASANDFLPIRADVSVETDVERMIDTVAAHFGGFNVLINNAAYGYFSPLTEIDAARFAQQLAVNISGVMYVGKHAAKYFIHHGGGTIVNIGSTAGQRGFANGTPYVATKFALAGMTQCWRYELRKHNIRVMQLDPSEVLTDFAVTAGHAQAASERKLRPAEIAHMIGAMLTLDDRGMVPELTVWATNPEG